MLKILLGKNKTSKASTDFGGDASRAFGWDTPIGSYSSNQLLHTKFENQPWWEVDLGRTEQVGLVPSG